MLDHEMTLEQIVHNYSRKVTVKPVESNLTSADCFPFETPGWNQLATKKVEAELKSNFPVLNLEFLRMRKDEWPRFAIFSLREPRSFHSISYTWAADELSSIYDTTNLPWIRDYFKDVYYKMASDLIEYSIKNVRSGMATLTCEFDGFIPADKRELINRVADKKNPHILKDGVEQKIPIFNDVFLIKEAEKWTYKVTGEPLQIVWPRSSDPLIVGIRNKQAYLIESFDVTRLEEYIGSEFTE